MIGIYKITNLINGQAYIGQTNSIERRFKEHLTKSILLIDKAIQEYGSNNFKFEIIEECTINDLNNREKYWIKYFNTITPFGYNQDEGGHSSNFSFNYSTEEEIQNIIKDIKYSNLTFTEIANKYNKNVSNISRINNGKIHIQENEIYPLRKKQNYPQIKNSIYANINSKICPICGNKKSYQAKICFKCLIFSNRKVDRPNREELKQMIREMTFTAIGEKYGVNDNTIRKWCKAEELPFRKIDINKYSIEEWEQI